MFAVKDQGKISGVGHTAFGRTPSDGRTELSLMLEATLAAVADAGLTPDAIDGIVAPIVGATVEQFATNLGLGDLAFSASLDLGGATPVASLGLAALAVASGRAHHVLIPTGTVAFSANRMRDCAKDPAALTAIGKPLRDHYLPFGATAPGHWYALMAQRHLIEYGTPPEAFGAIAVACRKHAQLNDNAVMQGRPLTMDDYLASPWVNRPYRLHDCSLEADGAGAVIVSAADDRTAGSSHDSVLITAVAEGRAYPADDLINRPDMLTIGLTHAAPRAWNSAGLGPEDMDFAQIYDCFTFEALQQLEEAGFCPRGKGERFVADGNIELGGRLPMNTAGGLLSEAHIIGINHVIEAVRQLRHEAGARQVADARAGAVTGFGDFADGSIAILTRGGS